jgi:hypothetical protein
MLHIHNGDSSANSLKESGIAGQHLAFREALCVGPVPQNLAEDDGLDVRAGFLAGDYAIDFAKCREELVAQQAALAGIPEHEEVVLWFEHDLFCQVHLVYLLSLIAQMDVSKTKLSLVCIDEFPGRENFRGLGELTAEEMASLFDKRVTISEAQKQVAVQAWWAYGQPTPQALESLLQQDTSALPFLRAALHKHLQRFPSVKNGLGLVENRVLELISQGYDKFASLFSAFGSGEPLFGYGDAQCWNDVKRMAQAKTPLLQIDVGDFDEAMRTNAFIEASLCLTRFGETVVSGHADSIRENGTDLWLGGVHLSADNLWRWNADSQALQFEDSI